MELRYKDGTPIRKYNSPKLQAIDMENKQTAVDWIVDQMLSEGHKEMWKDIIQQAKQMEREQTEISDDDIEKAAENYAWTIKTNTFSDPVKANELAESSIQDFKAAIKWYREQLKKML